MACIPFDELVFFWRGFGLGLEKRQRKKGSGDRNGEDEERKGRHLSS